MKGGYCDVVAYDTDFVAPPAPRPRRGRLITAGLIGFLLGAIGPHPKLPTAAAAPPTYERESREIESLREESRLTPLQRVEKVGRANHEPYWRKGGEE